MLGRRLDAKLVPRLEQSALGLHEPLAHRAVDRLAEVAALGVLGVGSACDEAYFHIRYR